MSIVYNQIANRSLERIGALSDGLFAIAMTLIVLEIRVPELGPTAGDGEIAKALGGLAPRFVTYLLSFLTLGIFWNGQQTQLTYLAPRQPRPGVAVAALPLDRRPVPVHDLAPRRVPRVAPRPRAVLVGHRLVRARAAGDLDLRRAGGAPP